MTPEDANEAIEKTLQFLMLNMKIRGGAPTEIGLICAGLSARVIVALAGTHGDYQHARGLTQAFMLDVETLVTGLVKELEAKAPAP